jgi:hypothetical protein
MYVQDHIIILLLPSDNDTTILLSFYITHEPAIPSGKRLHSELENHHL